MAPEKSDSTKPLQTAELSVDPDELQDYIESGLDADGNYARILHSLGHTATRSGA